MFFTSELTPIILVNQAVETGWMNKRSLKESTTIKSLDIRHLSDNQVVVKNGQLVLSGLDETFPYLSSAGIISAIASADFLDESGETIIAYYPNKEYGKIVGKTEITMSFNQSADFFRRCAADMGATLEQAKLSVALMFSKSFYRRDGVSLSDKDLLPELLKKM